MQPHWPELSHAATAALLMCAATMIFCRNPVFKSSESHRLRRLRPVRRGKFVKLTQAQVRISPSLWFPSGTFSNWSELPNGGRSDFPHGCCWVHRRVPPDFRLQLHTILPNLHSIIDSDRKQQWEFFFLRKKTNLLVCLSLNRRIIPHFGTRSGFRNFRKKNYNNASLCQRQVIKEWSEMCAERIYR